MRKFLVLRKLAGSDLGWFAAARRQGKARGRQRGINFNAKIMARIFTLPESHTIDVQTVRYSDGQTQKRSIKKQQKNWRLVGDMVSGRTLDLVDAGDFFWCIVESNDTDPPILVWDVISLLQNPETYSLIKSEFDSMFTGSMSAWEIEDRKADRLQSLLGLKTAANGSTDQRRIKVTSGHSEEGILLRSGNSPLRPRARLVQAIGQDLISNEVVALVELIKNAYDADASSVDVRFNPPLSPEKGAIIVRDDGHGMSLDVLLSAWMEPATISKLKKRNSPSGRRMTGEKGLGRFAAARLARKMSVDSIARGSERRIVAEYDWEEFRDENRFLDQVKCDWNEFSVQAATPSGTTLTLSGLRDGWDSEAFRRLRAELARLIARQVESNPFIITLYLPHEFESLSGPITPPPVLFRPHYSLIGSVSNSGTLNAILRVGNEEKSVDQKILLKNGRPPACGPFSLDLKVWDRDRDELGRLALDLGSTVTDIRRDLNEAAGVSIYRDGFRVLPYGSSTNDWLRLNIRRVQNPTLRLSNNQIVGAVYISADESPDLRDQTNREGIVESPAFADLKACVNEVLAIIETARYDLRRKTEKLENQPSLFDELNLAPIRVAFAAKYPKDKEFLDYLEEKDRRVKTSVEHIQEVIVRYRRLATLGQLVDVVLHDGRTPVSSISNQCELGRRDLKRASSSEELSAKLSERFATIDTQAVVLSELFKRISPFSGRRRGRPKDYRLESLISDSFALLHEQVNDLDVRVTLPDSSNVVRVDASEIQQVFLNLAENAIYWLAKVPREDRQIIVQIDKKDDYIEIIFSDNGPGIPDKIRNAVFDPYFSAKPDGVGLGLTIAGEIVSEYAGSLELIEPGLLPGANFRLTFKTAA